MKTRNLCFAVCTVAIATTCLHAPELRAQSISGAAPIEMVTNDGKDTIQRRSSHDGLMEPVGLALDGGLAITLEVAQEKAGEPVIVTPLDGGLINATLTTDEGEVSLSGYGTDFQEETFVSEDGTVRRESLLVGEDGEVVRQGLFVSEGGTVRRDSLIVSGDGTVGFSFKPGGTTGLYRVLVIIGAEQYELQLYAVRTPTSH